MGEPVPPFDLQSEYGRREHLDQKPISKKLFPVFSFDRKQVWLFNFGAGCKSPLNLIRRFCGSFERTSDISVLSIAAMRAWHATLSSKKVGGVPS